MVSDIQAKVNKLITAANQIAVILPEQLNVDSTTAAMAIHKYLTAIGKQAAVFSSGINIPGLEFIPNHPVIYSNLGARNELTIKVNSHNVKPKQLRYEKQQDDLVIYITPEGIESSSDNNESKQFTASDVEIIPAVSSFDLLLLVGVDNLESIGKLYETNTELFFHTPKIAISNKIDQEYFATVTWVESNVPSLSEQVADWLGAENPGILKDDFVSTALLAGIISATQSFSDPRTTPDTLSVAAKLVSNGARRQDIIKHLFKTKPFNLLQLWGRALARIKTFQENTILYTVLTAQDFSKTQTDLSYLPQVLTEIISMANNYKLIIVAAETAAGVELLFAGPPHVKIKQIARSIDPTFSGATQLLLGNYQYLALDLPNFKLEDLEAVVSTLGSTGI
ncbi:hypothetical protein IPM19_04925 [bacterium]|nr:MAG: hypothetical protein IPM19_04925 [bacterium]